VETEDVVPGDPVNVFEVAGGVPMQWVVRRKQPRKELSLRQTLRVLRLAPESGGELPVSLANLLAGERGIPQTVREIVEDRVEVLGQHLGRDPDRLALGPDGSGSAKEVRAIRKVGGRVRQRTPGDQVGGEGGEARFPGWILHRASQDVSLDGNGLRHPILRGDERETVGEDVSYDLPG
jgi:hypothetical protein